MDGQRLSTIRPSSGFLGQKTSSTRTLAFHPNLMVMAASGNDGYINVSYIIYSLITWNTNILLAIWNTLTKFISDNI
jgi:type IV secretory pathway TraG/TraD family ATPase VirD4